jgi:Integrase core domain
MVWGDIPTTCLSRGYGGLSSTKRSCLKAYQDAKAARLEISRYIAFYNAERPHQSLGYKTPAEEYLANAIAAFQGPVLESETFRTLAMNPGRIAGSYLNLE